jgi:hypothetical protein
MKPFRILTASTALALGLAALPAAAQGPGPARFHLALAYDGRLLVKVLEMQVDQTAAGVGFASTVRLRSFGILAAFKHFDVHASAQGRIAGGAAYPRAFHHQNIDGKGNRRGDVTWTGTDVTAVFQPPHKWLGEPPASRAQKLESMDPLTGLMRIALGAGDGARCRGTLKLFDGKQRYDLEFSGAASGKLAAREVKLGLVNPLRCQVRYREVAGFKRKTAAQANEGMKRPVAVGLAQVGAGGPWVISYLNAPTPLGYAVVELERVGR